ncbi:DUF1772 domain-containing protein [Microvirga brassicacearum]|uniref:DUF1772 domain-containing protein n=1 Tax=Microvirga brassicacearum TaxID=2580413 RepID=A0A5N3PET7_9HYPH|nr:DUF1772 domain-containing protein [Microvirga brassicacearum]
MVYDVVFFIALLATALALGAALAHVLELPNKIGLPRDEYFIVQQVYRGWDRLAFLLLVELAAMIALAVMSRRRPRVFWPVVGAIFCLLSAQLLFWLFTFPANVATENWTRMPNDWGRLRTQWEYSHLAGAIFQVLAMAALIVAALAHARTGAVARAPYSSPGG